MKASISLIPKRNVVKLDKARGIFNNGADNAYPQRVERLINTSVTAKSCADMLTKFIIGNGFEDETLNDIIISRNLFGKTTLFKLLSQVARTVSRQNGASLSLRFDANYNISEVNHIPFRDCRYGMADTKDYSGLIHYYNNWQKDVAIGTFKPSDIAKINVFNPDANVIKAQWAKEEKNYRGQIAMLHLDDEYIYPLAPIDSAIEDADTEAQIKLFKNSELNKGFFAKYMMYHTAFETQQDAEDFKNVLKKFEGGGHDSSIMLLEGTFDEEGNLIKSDNIKLEKVEQNINDKLFESYEKSVSNNIRKAFYSIPAILIEQQDGGFFGSSGEAFVQAFNFYNTQTADIRAAVSQWFADVMSIHADVKLRTANYTLKKLSYGTMDAGGATNDTPTGQQQQRTF